MTAASRRPKSSSEDPSVELEAPSDVERPRQKRKRPVDSERPPSPRRNPSDLLGSFFSQNHILAGAAEAFRSHGIEGATVEDILRAAGVSRRTFYKAFKSKEDVLDALHRGLADLFMQAIRLASVSSKQEERIHSCIDVFLLAAQRSSGLMLQLQAEAQRRERLGLRRQAMFRELTAMIEDGFREAGREPPPSLLVHGLLIGLEGIVRHQLETGRLADSDLAQARSAMLMLARGALDIVAPQTLTNSRNDTLT